VSAFIDMLLASNLFDDAGAVWRRAMADKLPQSANPDNASLIFDGGFEADPSQGGFGWRQEDVSGADFDLDPDVKHGGARSARVIFDGAQNLLYGHLYQFVLVVPSTRYRFQAFLRGSTITTDSGLRFEIYDSRNRQAMDVFTPNEKGTLDWTLEQLDFTTGPSTRLLRVQLTRQPSARFDNKLSGTVWVDDVSLVPYGSPK
jgi:hypothetical protein